MFYVFYKKRILTMVILLGIAISGMLLCNLYMSSIVAGITQNVIIIDPGHGGEDCGAIGTAGTKEKDLNLSIAMKLKEKLLNTGFNVVITRDEDKMLIPDNAKKNKKRTDLNSRVKVAENYENAVFISIHMNHFDDNNQKGAQIFYSKNNPDSKKLATLIDKNFKVSIAPDNKREIKKAGSEIYILNKIKNPACLIECGFISNPNEEKKLSEEAYQWKITDSIINGICEFFY
ncbi:MAG: hypothetical protein E7411_03850 [Ruminococcaceae bacterium]|nr:hypothetical protein [Oscillospiraceae bacterium]